MLHVWNIYQHVPYTWPSFVGQYSSTMRNAEHLVSIYHIYNIYVYIITILPLSIDITKSCSILLHYCHIRPNRNIWKKDHHCWQPLLYIYHWIEPPRPSTAQTMASLLPGSLPRRLVRDHLPGAIAERKSKQKRYGDSNITNICVHIYILYIYISNYIKSYIYIYM